MQRLAIWYCKGRQAGQCSLMLEEEAALLQVPFYPPLIYYMALPSTLNKGAASVRGGKRVQSDAGRGMKLRAAHLQ